MTDQRATDNEILELLSRENPLFQLRPGTRGLPSAEALFLEKGGTDTGRFERASAALPLASLTLLQRHLRPEHTTLEIGGGHSTVAIASRVAHHYCVNPDKTANTLIQEFLVAHDLGCDNVTFIEDSSDRALPGFDPPAPIDVALLDGNHSFPFPMLDWHYSDRHLVRGSKLILDNIEIPAVRMLSEFLRLEPGYELVDRATGHHRYDCYVYEKRVDHVSMGWMGQGINRTSLLRLCLDVNLARMWRPIQRLRHRFRT